jgi:hypothetical protein
LQVPTSASGSPRAETLTQAWTHSRHAPATAVGSATPLGRAAPPSRLHAGASVKSEAVLPVVVPAVEDRDVVMFNEVLKCVASSVFGLQVSLDHAPGANCGLHHWYTVALLQAHVRGRQQRRRAGLPPVQLSPVPPSPRPHTAEHHPLDGGLQVGVGAGSRAPPTPVGGRGAREGALDGESTSSGLLGGHSPGGTSVGPGLPPADTETPPTLSRASHWHVGSPHDASALVAAPAAPGAGGEPGSGGDVAVADISDDGVVTVV